MKLIFAVLVLSIFSAQASPILSVKERLRIHLWSYGLEQKAEVIKIQPNPKKILPEELERPLRKI